MTCASSNLLASFSFSSCTVVKKDNQDKLGQRDCRSSAKLLVKGNAPYSRSFWDRRKLSTK